MSKATSGLTAGEAALLKKQLKPIENIIEHRALYGGNEIVRAVGLQRRLENRLNPENPKALADEAKAFADQFHSHIAKVRADNEKRERRHAEEIAAIRAEEARLRAAKQARIDERKRRLAQAAVAEVL